MTLPLTRVELDQMHTCQCADCKRTGLAQIYLHQRCHQGAPTWSFYERAKGTLTVECSVCRKPIAVIKVAAALIEG